MEESDDQVFLESALHLLIFKALHSVLFQEGDLCMLSKAFFSRNIEPVDMDFLINNNLISYGLLLF